MKIEHFAYEVEKPAAVADWYGEHLGFIVKRSADSPVPVRFLADESGDVMIEIYNNPKGVTPDYASMNPLILHLAFVCDAVEETAERLVAAGAVMFSGNGAFQILMTGISYARTPDARIEGHGIWSRLTDSVGQQVLHIDIISWDVWEDGVDYVGGFPQDIVYALEGNWPTDNSECDFSGISMTSPARNNGWSLYL